MADTTVNDDDGDIAADGGGDGDNDEYDDVDNDVALIESAEALAEAEEEAAERSAFAVVFVGVVDAFLLMVNAALMRYFFGWPLPSTAAAAPLMQMHFLHVPGLVAFCLPVLATPPAWLGVACGMLSAMLLGIDGYVLYKHALALAGGAVTLDVLLPAVMGLAFVLTAAWYGVCALGFSRHYTWCGEPRRRHWLRLRSRRRLGRSRLRRRAASPPAPPPRSRRPPSPPPLLPADSASNTRFMFPTDAGALPSGPWR